VPALERQHQEDMQRAQVTVGTVRKSMAIVPAKCIRTNVAHVLDGGRPGRPVRFGIYFATASLLTSWPSLVSAMRRRLHVGFSRVIRSISAMISAETGGRPGRRDLCAQKRATSRLG
jgi:hypothetical protein